MQLLFMLESDNRHVRLDVRGIPLLSQSIFKTYARILRYHNTPDMQGCNEMKDTLLIAVWR